MKPHEVSMSIVAYKNDPERMVSAIQSIPTARPRITWTAVDQSPAPHLIPRETEIRSGINFFGKRSTIDDAERRSLNAKTVAVTRYPAGRERAA